MTLFFVEGQHPKKPLIFTVITNFATNLASGRCSSAIRLVLGVNAEHRDKIETHTANPWVKIFKKEI
jgi:hypothetical protein